MPGLRWQEAAIRVLHDPERRAVGYCKSCQRAVSRRSRRRRNAALRALIALHPEEWRVVLQHDSDDSESTAGGGADVA